MSKRQRVDATLDLVIRDERIARENIILQKLKHAGRSNRARPGLAKQRFGPNALYMYYRGNGFPIKTHGNRKLPAWRYLSPWMKAQLAFLCISEHEHRQFRVHLHDELRVHLKSHGKDLKVYLRDRISRTLREGLGKNPWYLFVIEDLDKDGKTLVRPHAHGVIVIRPRDLGTIENKRSQASYRRCIRSHGQKAVELRAGLQLTRTLLKDASGNGPRAAKQVNGLSQKDNVWLRRSYHPFFNDQSISYAFKNAHSNLSELPSDRLAKSQGVWLEARRLWELIRKGEPAMAQWS